MNAKFSRLDEKEKNAGCLQLHLQRKRDRYLKKQQALRQKYEACDKSETENDQRKQEMDKTWHKTKEIQQEIE